MQRLLWGLVPYQAALQPGRTKSLSHISQPSLSHTQLGARSWHRPTVLPWVMSLPSLTSVSGLLVYLCRLSAPGCPHALSYPVLQGVEITSSGFERSEGSTRALVQFLLSLTVGKPAHSRTLLSLAPVPSHSSHSPPRPSKPLPPSLCPEARGHSVGPLYRSQSHQCPCSVAMKGHHNRDNKREHFVGSGLQV